MLYGGPAVIIWGFVGCFVFAVPMARSMAEISSPFVTAGGPYFWWVSPRPADLKRH